MRRSPIPAALVGLMTMVVIVGARPIADNVDVQIDEWVTPSNIGMKGTTDLLHTPGLAPDGSLWYAAAKTEFVGRFDPKTQQFKEYAMPTPSNPHGVISDKDGNIWYGGFSSGLLGKIDPKTGKIAEYKVGDPKTATPHTMVFDQRGIMYFTTGRSQLGVFDPKDGKVTLLTPPTENAGPHGIVVDSKGIVYFGEGQQPNIGRLDPKTMMITEIALPDKAARVRRLVIAKDDTIWYADYGRGVIGHLDPKSGKVLEEHPSPGGAKSLPYAMQFTSDGAIWYVETGVQTANVLVRFNPETKKFQTWPIPGGGGFVRQMVVDKDDNIWMAETGVGKIARVRTKGVKK